jgi:hypothetical protein
MVLGKKPLSSVILESVSPQVDIISVGAYPPSVSWACSAYCLSPVKDAVELRWKNMCIRRVSVR